MLQITSHTQGKLIADRDNGAEPRVVFFEAFVNECEVDREIAQNFLLKSSFTCSEEYNTILNS